MKKTKTLKINSIRPSSIIEANYHKNLLQITKSTKNTINEIVKDYSKAKSDPMYVNIIANRFEQAFIQWESAFSDEAERIATSFTDSTLTVVDRQLAKEFRRSNISISFQMSEKMQAKIQSKISENVSLIKSIPQQYLTEVQGVVMRSIERGSDLKTLSEILQYRYGVTARRAKNIAIDQSGKANAAFTRQRQIDVGIKKGEWVHSGLGKEKRASHVKAGRDRLVFDLDKGALIDGEYIFPGEKINCRCTWRAVLFDGNNKQN